MDLEFTGERLIPGKNKGFTAFYEHLARYLFSAQIVQGKSVLDAGCGVGYGSNLLVSEGKAARVKGIDIAADAIEYAQTHDPEAHVEFIQDDVTKMQNVQDAEVDVVVSFELIEHIEDHDAFLSQVKRVMKPGGIFIVSTPNKNNYPEGNHFHVKELYPQEFESKLKEHFINVQLLHQDFDFAQVIKRTDRPAFQFEEQFYRDQATAFVSPTTMQDSQYLLAVCSDDQLPDMQTVIITANRLDNLDLTKGIVSLGKQHGGLDNWAHELESYAKRLEAQVSTLQRDIHKLRSRRSVRIIEKLSHSKVFNNTITRKFAALVTGIHK